MKTRKLFKEKGEINVKLHIKYGHEKCICGIKASLQTNRNIK